MNLEVGFSIHASDELAATGEAGESLIDAVFDIDDNAFVQVGDNGKGVVWLEIAVSESQSDYIGAAMDLAEQLRSSGAVVDGLAQRLVNIPEIAERCDVAPQAVAKWVDAPGFPDPIDTLRGAVKIWSWADVHRWLAANKPTKTETTHCQLSPHDRALLAVRLYRDREIDQAGAGVSGAIRLLQERPNRWLGIPQTPDERPRSAEWPLSAVGPAA